MQINIYLALFNKYVLEFSKFFPVYGTCIIRCFWISFSSEVGRKGTSSTLKTFQRRGARILSRHTRVREIRSVILSDVERKNARPRRSAVSKWIEFSQFRRRLSLNFALKHLERRVCSNSDLAGRRDRPTALEIHLDGIQPTCRVLNASRLQLYR